MADTHRSERNCPVGVGSNVYMRRVDGCEASHCTEAIYFFEVAKFLSLKECGFSF
jgi:hypothetical protein